MYFYKYLQTNVFNNFLWQEKWWWISISARFKYSIVIGQFSLNLFTLTNTYINLIFNKVYIVYWIKNNRLSSFL